MNAPLLTPDPIKSFSKLFGTTARHFHRHEVFRDLIFCMAAALRNNGATFSRDIEDEYLAVMKRYSPEDAAAFRQMFGLVVQALDGSPQDVLGPIFMNLDLGDAWRGQFFTPNEISGLMSSLLHMDKILEHKRTGEPITISEPACGAGGLILAVVEEVLRAGLNPAQAMDVLAVDVDRTAALMAYIQLSLWNVPATVVVGNSLTLEEREVWLTPAKVNPIFKSGFSQEKMRT